MVKLLLLNGATFTEEDLKNPLLRRVLQEIRATQIVHLPPSSEEEDSETEEDENQDVMIIEDDDDTLIIPPSEDGQTDLTFTNSGNDNDGDDMPEGSYPTQFTRGMLQAALTITNAGFFYRKSKH